MELIHAEFFVEFTERGLFATFARFDQTAGQADLAGVMGERIGTDSQGQVPGVVDPMQQNDDGSRAGVQRWWAEMAAVGKFWLHRSTGGSTRQRPLQTCR